MPIQVTCPKCLKRFNVGEQHAGKQGPCPSCKTTIKIPELEDEVVIHAPETSGPVDSKGRSVLKTTRYKDAKFNLLIAVASGGVALLTLLGAVLLRGSEAVTASGRQPLVVLGLGAAALGPLLAWAAYQFLRDDELEPYRGRDVWLRSLAAGISYTGLWFLYGFLILRFFLPEDVAAGLEWYYPVVCMAIVVAAGTLVGYVAFDLEPLNAAMHFGFFLLVTVILRAILGLQLIPGLGTGNLAEESAPVAAIVDHDPTALRACATPVSVELSPMCSSQSADPASSKRAIT